MTWAETELDITALILKAVEMADKAANCYMTHPQVAVIAIEISHAFTAAATALTYYENTSMSRVSK